MSLLEHHWARVLPPPSISARSLCPGRCAILRAHTPGADANRLAFVNREPFHVHPSEPLGRLLRRLDVLHQPTLDRRDGRRGGAGARIHIAAIVPAVAAREERRRAETAVSSDR